MTKITQELVQSLFTYRNGELYWKKLTSNKSRVKIGNLAGTLINNGYYSIKINNKLYRIHRLIFLYHHGYLPKFIDHIDRNPLNNHIENLREVTQSQNNMNCKSYKNGTSKYKGVSWDKNCKKWRSEIRINYKSIYLGLFINEKLAAIAYNTKAIELFGKYANLNEV